jgi:hypothetical protein
MHAFFMAVGADLAEIVSEAHEFTTVGVGQGIPKLTLGVISFGEGLAAVGLVEKGAAVATRRRRFKVTQTEAIEPPLQIDELIAEMSPRLQRHVHFGLVAERTSEEACAALGRLRPELAPHIARLRRRIAEPTFRRPGYETAALEKDAIGLALGFQGIDRDALRDWEPEDQPEHFLRGLSQATLREDQILNHDLGVFDDWDVVAESAVGAVHFEKAGVGVTVVNVNRTPVEEVLGVDLLYFHEVYRSFVLVQYKRFEDDGEEGMGPVYRPDENLEGELELMRKIAPTLPNPVDELSYRLGPGVCFLKLCKSVRFDPYSRDLIAGMYLPLEYFDACEPTARGPRGGRAYSYSTLRRHLNNSQFIELVQDGWIGSNGTLSEELQSLVGSLIEGGRSVLLASGSGVRGRVPRAAHR